MGWLQKVLAQLPLIPGILQGIEVIHQEAGSGATKKQMAMDALGLAAGAAGAALPEFAPEIQAATSLASGTIDLIVAGFNATKGWGGGHGVMPILPAAAVTAPASRKIG